MNEKESSFQEAKSHRNKWAFFVLGLTAVLSIAAIQTVGPFIQALSNNRYIRPGTGFEQITNIVGTAVAGTKIWFMGPATYHIPTNTTTWAKPGVDFHFDAGVTMVFGANGDATGADFRPIWSDSGAATTNRITGYADFVVSNRFSTLVDYSQGASKIYFECNNASRMATTLEAAVFKQSSCDMRVLVRDTIRNEGYDGWWIGTAAGARTWLKAGRIFVADTAIEMDSSFDGDKPGVIEVGVIEKNQNGNGSFVFMQLHGNINISCGTAYMGTNCTIYYYGGVSARPAVLDCKEIWLKSHTSGEYMFNIDGSGGPIGTFRIQNARIYAPTNSITPFLVWDATLGLENCEVIATSDTITTGFGIGSAAIVEARNLKVNKPFGDGVAVNGGPIIGVATNAYDTTNVFWNVGGHEQQFLNATNAMLLIMTNAVGLESGKLGQLMIKNDKATNMNVAISADGRRVFGDALQINAGMVSLTVTNGRTVLLDYQRVGTNNMLTVKQQQN